MNLFEIAASGVTSEMPMPATGRDKAPLDWSPDMQLMSVPLETAGASGEASPGMPEALFETRIATTGPYVFTAGILAKAQYAVAADGRLLMNVADDALASPIMVVLNWPAALRR